MSASRETQSGFTLLELLVALACAALLSAVLANTLRLSLDGWERSAEWKERSFALQSTEQLLIHLIEQVRPPTLGRSNTETPVSLFDGEISSLRFMAPAPSKIFDQDYLEYTIGLRQKGPDRHLEIRWQVPGNFDAAQGRSTLVESVEGLNVSYFKRTNPNDTGIWIDRWTDEASLPSIIRLSLDLPGPGGPWTHQIFAAPRLLNSTFCSKTGVGCRYMVTQR